MNRAQFPYGETIQLFVVVHSWVHSHSRSDMNPVYVVLGLHVNLEPFIHILGIPAGADLIVDYSGVTV